MKSLGMAITLPLMFLVAVCYMPDPAAIRAQQAVTQAVNQAAQESHQRIPELKELAEQFQAIKAEELAQTERDLGNRFRALLGQEPVSQEQETQQDTPRETREPAPRQYQAKKPKKKAEPKQSTDQKVPGDKDSGDTAPEKPVLKLPESIEGEPGDFIPVRPETNGGQVEWLALDKGLSVFPGNMLRDPTQTVVTARDNGVYRLLGYTAVGDIPSPPAIVNIVIGGGEPDPDTDPDTGPGPQPPVGFGLAVQVPIWLTTVPEAHRANKTKVKTAFLSVANNPGATIEAMQNSVGKALGESGIEMSQWAGFGNAYNAAIIALMASKKIATPAEFAAALKEVAGAL